MIRRACYAIGFCLSAFAGSVWADDPAATGTEQDAESPRYSRRREHDPNGIGKFYMGREIARVMGWQAAPWLERPQREQEEKLSLLVKSLKLEPGMVVADIGAGSGVISLMMAEKVQPGGKVLAVDVQEEMLLLLQKKLDAAGVKNVEPVLGTAKSPKLKPNSVDLAIMVDVYHEFEFPYEMTAELAKALKPGGRLAFVEYRREDPKVRRMIKLVHTMTEAQVKKEIGQPEFGLRWKETIDRLPVQHIVIFEKPKGEGVTLDPPDGLKIQSPEGAAYESPGRSEAARSDASAALGNEPTKIPKS